MAMLQYGQKILEKEKVREEDYVTKEFTLEEMRK